MGCADVETVGTETNSFAMVCERPEREQGKNSPVGHQGGRGKEELGAIGVGQKGVDGG